MLHLYTREQGARGRHGEGRQAGALALRRAARAALQGRPRDARGEGRAGTVTSASTVSAHRDLRDRRDPLQRATQACDAVLRLFDSQEPNRRRLQPALQRADAARLEPPRAASRAQALVVQAEAAAGGGLPARAGLLRHLRRARGPRRFSASAGGVVCAGCEAGSFPLDPEAHAFLVGALARPLADAPAAAGRRAEAGGPGHRGDVGTPRSREARPRGLTAQTFAGLRPRSAACVRKLASLGPSPARFSLVRSARVGPASFRNSSVVLRRSFFGAVGRWWMRREGISTPRWSWLVLGLSLRRRDRRLR